METMYLTRQLSIKDRKELIQRLNLEPIMVKLMDSEEGESWTLEQSLMAEKWYKRFLILNLKYPDQSFVPNHQIDTFWHYHILDTMKYQEDCNQTFGYFLHHFPYFGLRGPKDKENQISAFQETVDFFQDEFGESLFELNSVFNKNEGATCFGNNCGNTCNTAHLSNEIATCNGNNCGNRVYTRNSMKPANEIATCNGNNCGNSCNVASNSTFDRNVRPSLTLI